MNDTREFDLIKISDNAFKSNLQSYQLREKHSEAKYTRIIGVLEDKELADIIIDFLNKREEVFEQNRLKMINKVKA